MKQKILQIVVLIILGAGAWYYLSHHEVPSNQPTTTDSTTAQTFSSDKLGVSFSYMPDQDGDGQPDTAAKEVNDKIYLYYTASPVEQGQWVQVFTKDPSQTLETAIQDKFLKNYSAKDCYVQDFNQFFTANGAPAQPQADNIAKAIIVYPLPTDDSQPFWQNASKCPVDYSLSNGQSYFLMDKNHPDKYLFFSIGQYGIVANLEKQQAWQDTFQVTK